MWISKQLDFLKDICNVVLGFKSYGESTKKDFNITKTKTIEFLLNASLDNCEGKAERCDLFNLTEKKQGYLGDFICNRQNVSSDTKIIVFADESHKYKTYNQSCIHCLFENSLKCLLNSIELAVLKTNLNTPSFNHDVELYGLKFTNTQEDGSTKAFLAFNFQGSSNYEDLYLLCQCYGMQRLVKISRDHSTNKYLVSQNSDIYSFTRLMNVVLVPVDDVYFYSAKTGANESLYLSNKAVFDKSFREYSQKIGRAKGDRDVIYSNFKVPKKEKASSNILLDSVPSFSSFKKIADMKSEIFFTSVLIILIAILYKKKNTEYKKVSVL